MGSGKFVVTLVSDKLISAHDLSLFHISNQKVSLSNGGNGMLQVSTANSSVAPTQSTYFFMYPYEHTLLWNVKKYGFWVGNGHQKGAILSRRMTFIQ